MEKIKSFQITGMTISGFKCYQEPTELAFGNPTIITGGNGRGKTVDLIHIRFLRIPEKLSGIGGQ